jgi:iron complex outermembrane recepter protein
MRKRFALAVLIVANLFVSPAFPQVSNRIDIPAQALDSALLALGEQAQISIGGIDTRIATAGSHAVRGTMSVADALSTMLRDTGFDFVVIDARTVQIVRATATSVPAPSPAPVSLTNRPPRAEPPPEPLHEIIVTASKQRQSLGNYAGTVHVEKFGSVGLAGSDASAALVARLPTLSSTNLGPGRNKIFIRGIADSSFAGPTQSTAGLYLGELRMTYSAPEPDLRLYDIDRIEVAEGPQGTLYGAGTLGGIVRIVPNEPNLTGVHGSSSAGVSITTGGSSAFDFGGTINLPLITDRLGLRVTGYLQREGGTTDNAQTGATNTDETHVRGARASLRLVPAEDWTIDVGGAFQFLETSDAHYAQRGLPRRTRRAAIAQPHENDFRATSLNIAKQGDFLSLISVTGVVLHDLSSVFDASGYQGRPGISAYRQDNRIRLITHETRLSHVGEGASTWVLGASYTGSSDTEERALGSPGALVNLASLRNRKAESALFGEATRSIDPHWAATLGARLTYARTVGELIGGNNNGFEPNRNEWRLLPTVALSWKPYSDMIAFLRYHSGFRSGGIAIASDQINNARRFASDKIDTIELGMRFGSGMENRFSGGITALHSTWNEVQADLINASGVQYTDNIGHGRITGLESNVEWRLSPAMTLDGALFINDSVLRSAPTSATNLPNVPKLGARAIFSWNKPLTTRTTLHLGGSARYVGVSLLGTTAPLILEQGETLQADLEAAIETGAWKVSLDIANVFNSGGNSFSFGNPFTASLGQQITPLQPPTVHLGVATTWGRLDRR